MKSFFIPTIITAGSIMDELLSWLIKASKIHKPGFCLPRERAQVAVFPRSSEFVVVGVYSLASLLTVTDENWMPGSTCKFFTAALHMLN